MGIAVGIAVLVAYGACMRLTAWVAEQKGRRFGEGIVLWLIFGPFGMLVELCLPVKN